MQTSNKSEYNSIKKGRVILNDISHSLRTPITCILGFSHLLNSTKLTVEQKKYLQNINQATHQLLDATNYLIDDLRSNRS